MASESETMLPCPFCGATPPLPEGLGTQYEIECHCGCARASVQICDLMTLAERTTGWDEDKFCYHPEFVERAKTAAIDEWNARAPSAEAKDVGYRRYEYIRTLSPRAYAELWARNIHGEGPFDSLVDVAIAQHGAET